MAARVTWPREELTVNVGLATVPGHDPDYVHFAYADLDEMHPAVRTVLLMQLYNPPSSEGLPLFTVERSGEEPLFDAETAAWAATVTPEEFFARYAQVQRDWRRYSDRLDPYRLGDHGAGGE